jgi:uncharacterized protein YndB with AHSA1/START domain
MTVKVEFSDDLQATAERIWDVLTDVKHYPEWVRDISAVDPPAGPEQRDSTFRFKLSGLTYSVTVLEAERPRRLTWYGVGNGLKTTHEWELVEAEGKTRVRNTEITSGWPATLAYPIVKRGMSRIEAKWLADLKHKAQDRP